MALRNAFDNLATEGTLRRLLNNLNFSRTATDALRVNVDNTVTVTASLNMNNSATAGSIPIWYSQPSVVSIDQREGVRAQYRANAIAIRTGRWTF